ncbi:hypothetical protein [Photorhabdus sp. SF281]|uniref:hypothetical protein n=1 Tax=Photorhabdus sp. SF281 TaxID=3459527 RepID=UPI0040444BF1
MINSEKINVKYERAIFISRDGREFNINDNSWKLNKNVMVAVKWISRLKSIVELPLKTVLARCAEEYAAETVTGLNNQARRYFNLTGDREFLVDSLIWYRTTLSRDKEQNLSQIRMLVRNWIGWGYPGISQEVHDFLDGLRLRGMEKGKAIKRLDPKNGPLTEIEMSALIDAMLQAYISNKINLSDYTLSATLVYTGRRPIQITSMKIKDICSRKVGEIDEYWINFPRAKQRFSKWRTEFNVYPINEELWRLLTQHILNVSSKVAKLVKFELSAQVIQELPIFPDFSAIREYKDNKSFIAALDSDALHVERDFCNEVMKKMTVLLDVYSERTGQRLNLSTRRFRYTLGSNIAREGKG